MMKGDPDEHFQKKFFCVIQKLNIVYAYTEYTHNQLSLHPIKSINKNFVPGWPIDQIYSVLDKKFKILYLRNLMSVYL